MRGVRSDSSRFRHSILTNSSRPSSMDSYGGDCKEAIPDEIKMDVWRLKPKADVESRQHAIDDSSATCI
jgi:hypothetical protein